MPNIKNGITMFIESVLPELRKKSKVHIIWLVYQPERQKLFLEKIKDETIIFIQDYKNGIDVLKKEKPDIVFASATWSFIDYALSSSAKFLNIPVFSMFWSDWYYGSAVTKTTRMKLLLARFFERSIPTDTDQNQKQFMRRGRFYIYKFLFLFKTHRVMNMSELNMLKLLFFMIIQILTDPPFNPRFSNTKHFLEDGDLKKSLLQVGFNDSSLIVTGNPLFDAAFQKSQNKDMIIKKMDDCIIRVLFAPSALYEHGLWTKNQKDFAVKQTISALAEKKNKVTVIVKLHPSSSLLSEYQPIINSIDDSISVYQNGDIQQFLDNVDVSISFQSSTAEIYSMIAKKPVVICNFFGSKIDKFVENGIALECTNPSDLVKIIYQSMSDKSYEKNREKFIQKFMYRGDGLAAERISNEIINLL
jgi:hypothetical protein